MPGSPGHLLPSELNPNGASELAALMRTMQANLAEARGAVLEGRPTPPLWPSHRKMRCAWPTDAADRNPQFDALAIAYLAQVKALDARGADGRQAYRAVLAACRACHEVSCPGPIAAIEALALDAPPAPR